MPFFPHHKDTATAAKEACVPGSPTCLSEQRPETRGTAQCTPLHQARYPSAVGRLAASGQRCAAMPPTQAVTAPLPSPADRAPSPPHPQVSCVLSSSHDPQWRPAFRQSGLGTTCSQLSFPLDSGRGTLSTKGTTAAFQKWDRVCRLGGAGAREKPPWGSRGQCVHQLQAHILLFSRSVVSNSLWPHGPQHARLPCP